MKQLLLIATFFTAITAASAQVTITSADMPVAGDTLRYSIASGLSPSINLADTGTGLHWHYMDLTPVSQAVDTYKRAYQVNPVYAGTISLSARGYKVADSIPGISLVASGLTVNNVYYFFENLTSPSAYAAAAFAANIAGLFPAAFNYAAPDVWYFFPLTYGRSDSSDFELNMSLMTFGGIKQKGYRKTRVDAWGSIMTPLYTGPENCLRVRSQITEVDSVSMSGTSFGIARTTIEYKWLIPGQHYPALWITANVIGGVEIPTIIRYRDRYRQLNPASVQHASASYAPVTASPNPLTNGTTELHIPAAAGVFYVEVFDVQGKLLLTQKDERTINLNSYPSGNYLARITSATGTAYVKLVK